MLSLTPPHAARLLLLAARQAGTLRRLGDLPGHEFHGNQWTDHFAGAPTDKAGGAKWIKSKQNEYDTNKDFRAAVDAATLLTQGSTEAIYAASLSAAGKADLIAIPFFKEKLARDAKLSLAENPINSVKTYFKGQSTDDLDYVSLHDAGKALNNAIDRSAPLKDPIYRGLRVSPIDQSASTLSKRVPNERYEAIAKLKEGDTFSIHGASSFTADKSVADNFARGLDKGQGARKGQERSPYISAVTFEIQGAHGIPVAALSPWKQREVLSRGTFEVLSHEVTDGRTPDHHIVLRPKK